MLELKSLFVLLLIAQKGEQCMIYLGELIMPFELSMSITHRNSERISNLKLVPRLLPCK